MANLKQHKQTQFMLKTSEKIPNPIFPIIFFEANEKSTGQNKNEAICKHYAFDHLS